MRKEQILEEYHNIVGSDSIKARELIKKLGYKADHYLLQCLAQTYLDESLFEKDGTMRVNLERRKWRMAERYIIKAFNINSDCADVLYTMGKVRKANEQFDIAIYCFEKIVKLGVQGLMEGRCKFEAEYAKELINDSKFELYRLYYDKDKVLSHKYLKMYKKGLKEGVKTIYNPLSNFLINFKTEFRPLYVQ